MPHAVPPTGCGTEERCSGLGVHRPPQPRRDRPQPVDRASPVAPCGPHLREHQAPHLRELQVAGRQFGGREGRLRVGRVRQRQHAVPRHHVQPDPAASPSLRHVGHRQTGAHEQDVVTGSHRRRGTRPPRVGDETMRSAHRLGSPRHRGLAMTHRQHDGVGRAAGAVIERQSQPTAVATQIVDASVHGLEPHPVAHRFVQHVGEVVGEVHAWREADVGEVDVDVAAHPRQEVPGLVGQRAHALGGDVEPVAAGRWSSRPAPGRPRPDRRAGCRPADPQPRPAGPRAPPSGLRSRRHRLPPPPLSSSSAAPNHICLLN